jgi:hypothetical protein
VVHAQPVGDEHPLVVDFVGTLEAESRGNSTALQVSFIGAGSELPVLFGVVDAELRSCADATFEVAWIVFDAQCFRSTNF